MWWKYEEKQFCFSVNDYNHIHKHIHFKNFNPDLYILGKVDCVTTSSDKHKPCVFPVLWKGEYHNQCVLQGSTGKTWCATELKDSGKYKKWGHCGDSCPREGKEQLSIR